MQLVSTALYRLLSCTKEMMMKVLSFIVAVLCLLMTVSCATAQVGISSPIGRATNLYYTDVADYGTLEAAVAVVTAEGGGTIVVNSNVTVSTDLTVPNTVALESKCNKGKITVATGKVLNIQGQFSADKCQVFQCTGDEYCVRFGAVTNDVTSSTALSTRPDKVVNEVFPEWWGAVYSSQDTADMTATTRAINAAIRSLNPAQALPVSDGVYNFVSGGGGVVRITGPMEVSGTIKLTPAVDLVCDAPGSVFYYPYATNSYIRCNQVDGTDCVTATMDKTLFEGDSTYQVCQLKSGYNINQMLNTMPFRVRIENCGIFGLDTRDGTQGYGVVLGDPPTWAEDLKTSSLSINNYHEGFCSGNWTPTYGAYDSYLNNNVISRHGKSGLHLGQAASSKIWANHIHGNAGNGIDMCSYTNGMSIAGNHIQGNCVYPYKWYNTSLSSIEYQVPVTSWTAVNSTLTAGLGGIDGSYVIMELTSDNGYMYRDISSGISANTDYLFTVFFRRHNGTLTDAKEDSAVKVQVVGNDTSELLHSSISLVGSPMSSSTGLYYTRYLVKFNSGSNTSIKLKLIGTTSGKHSYWDGGELYRMPYNIVTNSTFTSATTGWTGTDATLASSSSRLTVTDSGSGGGYAYQNITTVVGAKYVLSYKYYRHATNPSNGRATIGIVGNVTSIYNGPIKTVEDTYESVPFQATATTTVIGLVSTEAGKVSVWDDVTVQRLDPCVNGVVSSAPLSGSKIENNTIESGGSDSGNLWAYIGSWIYAAKGSSYDSNYHEANAPGALPMRWVYTAYNRGMTFENNGFYLNSRTDQTPSCTAVYAESTFHTALVHNFVLDTSSSAITSPACTMYTAATYSYNTHLTDNTRYWIDPVLKYWVTDSDYADLYTGTIYAGSYVQAADGVFVDDVTVNDDLYVADRVSTKYTSTRTVHLGTFTGGVDDVAYINIGNTAFAGQIKVSLLPSFEVSDALGHVEMECAIYHAVGLESYTPGGENRCKITKADGNLSSWYGMAPIELVVQTVDASAGDITFVAGTSTIARTSGLSVIDADFIYLTVSGSASNDGTYEIVSVTDSAIVVDGTLVDEVSSTALVKQDNMRIPVYHMHPNGTENQTLYAIVEARSMFTTPSYANNAMRLTESLSTTAPAVPTPAHSWTTNWVNTWKYSGVKGVEGGDAALYIWADEGDNAGDKWSIVAQASDNDLSFQNNSVEKFKVDTSGNITVTGGLTLAGQSYLPVMVWDEYSAVKRMFIPEFTAGVNDVAYINFGDTSFTGQIDLKVYPSFLNTAALGSIEMRCSISHVEGEAVVDPSGTPTPGCSITRADGTLATWYGLAPLEVSTATVTAGAGADSLVFDAATKKISRASGGLDVFKTAFGRIQVASTASNDGLYTISTVSSTEIVVVETLVDETIAAVGNITQDNLRVPLYHISVVPSEYQSMIVEVSVRSMYTTPLFSNNAKRLIDRVTVTAPAVPDVPHSWTVPVTTFWNMRIEGIEAGDAVLEMWADEGDDTTDKWSIVAQAAASNALAIKNNTSEVFSLSTSGTPNIPSGQTYNINGSPHTHIYTTSLTVTGVEGGEAALLLYADEGDDASDKWSIESNADNHLYFKNNGISAGDVSTSAWTLPAAHIGGASNYMSVDGSGVASLVGSAKRILRMRPVMDVAKYIGGSSKPTYVTRGAVGGYSFPIYASDDEELFFRDIVPGRWDGSTSWTCGLFVYLASAEDVGDKFKFQLSHYGDDGVSGTTGSSVVDVEVETAVTTGHSAQYSNYHVVFTINASGAGYGSGWPINYRLRRIDAADPDITGEVVVKNWYCSYTVDKLFSAP